MNRLQKKCLIGSSLCHALLWLVLVVCLAFKGSEKKAQEEELPSIVTLLPNLEVTDGHSRGGNRNVTTVPTPQPQVKPQQVVQAPPPTPAPAPTPRVEEPRQESKPAPKVAERKPEPPAERPVAKAPIPVREKSKPEPKKFVFNEVGTSKSKTAKDRFTFEPSRSSTSKSSTAKTSSNHKQSAEFQQLAKAVDRIGQNIGARASTSTTIEMPGVGDGGALVANYAQLVKAKYDNAWLDPQDVSDETATVKTEVIIERNGNVLSARVLRKSGIPALDRSIQNALDRVRFVHPFPAGSSDKQRTFILNFNLKARRMTG